MRTREHVPHVRPMRSSKFASRDDPIESGLQLGPPSSAGNPVLPQSQWHLTHRRIRQDPNWGGNCNTCHGPFHGRAGDEEEGLARKANKQASGCVTDLGPLERADRREQLAVGEAQVPGRHRISGHSSLCCRQACRRNWRQGGRISRASRASRRTVGDQSRASFAPSESNADFGPYKALNQRFSAQEAFSILTTMIGQPRRRSLRAIHRLQPRQASGFDRLRR